VTSLAGDKAVILLKTLTEDIRTILARDPAARSTLEVIFCYPGLHALWFHRLAHLLWRHKLLFFARLISHFARFLTGIEIHPGASIGRRFFVDHGAGVVIGETAEIGDDVLLYQGVVLGGTTLRKGKRHPTVGNRVVMGAGAVALGAIAIGDEARVGAGSVVVKSVPSGATVVGIPGRIMEDHRPPLMNLEHGALPDPVAEAIRFFIREQDRMDERLNILETAGGIASVRDDLEEKMTIEAIFSQGGGI
jgi:serine O-acetyltransferase